MKYVIVERSWTKKGTPPNRIYHVALFADHLVHADMVPKGYHAVGAGDCSIETGGVVSVHGKSDTLDLVSSPADALFIQQWLTYGESMAVMASEAYDDLKPLCKHK